MNKPWMTIHIDECDEPLVPIPRTRLAFVEPHPYLQLGAPYGEQSPHRLRRGVLQRLLKVQEELARRRRGWKLLVFDAYRPCAVQQFMVEHSYAQMLRDAGLTAAQDREQQGRVWQQVLHFWAVPSADPATPPAHSTGAAIDIGLVDEAGECCDLGTPIDEFSERAAPDHFASAKRPHERQAHALRVELRALMRNQGFAQHPAEWWHFSYGDQLWAWRQLGAAGRAVYGRADLLAK